MKLHKEYSNMTCGLWVLPVKIHRGHSKIGMDNLVSNDCPWDLARLEGRYAQFVEGRSVGRREGWKKKTVQFLRGDGSGMEEAHLEKLRNFSGELAASCGSLLEKVT